MISIHRILCPIDLSDTSLRALDHAIALARWYESSLTALFVETMALGIDASPFGGAAGARTAVADGTYRSRLVGQMRTFVNRASGAAGVSGS